MRWVITAACAAALVAAMAFAGCGGGVCSADNCSCSGSESCDFECPQGGCAQSCDDDSVCTATCSGGGCSQGCTGNADCDFSCSGGGCTQSCLLSSGDCTATCSSGCVSDS